MFHLKTALLLARLVPHIQHALETSYLSPEEKQEGRRLAASLLLLLHKAAKTDAHPAPIRENWKSRPRMPNRSITKFWATIWREQP
jgi:hypothetical protein